MEEEKAIETLKELTRWRGLNIEIRDYEIDAIEILEAKPYTAYTLYCDILHESDEIAQMLKEVLEKE